MLTGNHHAHVHNRIPVHHSKMQSLKVECATCGAQDLVLMVWVAVPWASHVSAVLDLCWLPATKGNFPQLYSQVFQIQRKHVREIWCRAKPGKIKSGLKNGGNRSQVDVSLLQRCVLETVISQLTGENSFALRHKQPLFVYDYWSHPNIHAGKWEPSPKNKSFQSQIPNDRQLQPQDKHFSLLFLFDGLFLTQFYTHGLNHSSLAVFSLHQWKAFIFKSPQASFLKAPCAKQWNLLCPNIGMGENRSDLPQTLAAHEEALQLCSTVPTSEEWHTSQTTAAKAVEHLLRIIMLWKQMYSLVGLFFPPTKI